MHTFYNHSMRGQKPEMQQRVKRRATRTVSKAKEKPEKKAMNNLISLFFVTQRSQS
jgi:hypothetical protein